MEIEQLKDTARKIRLATLRSIHAVGTGHAGGALSIADLLAVLYFWGNAALPVTAPVEVNYAETAKEMLAAGDYLSPQIYGNYWYDKPIFFYWELIAAFSAFGVTDFAARFFPALFGVFGLLLTYAFARRLYDERTAFWSTLILGSCVLYAVLAKLILTDMSLFVFFGGTLAAFFLGYETGGRGYFYAAYACAGLATLTKGPIGILLPGLVIFVFLVLRRDFGARLAYSILPIPNKGTANWQYAWVPFIGPLIGAGLAVLFFQLVAP